MNPTKPVRRGRKPLPKNVRKEREDVFVKMIETRCADQEIADQLGLAVGSLRPIRRKLLEEGRIKRRSSVSDVKSERVQTIVTLVKQNATHQQIGDTIGITRERTRQLIHSIAEQHGQDTLTPDVRYFTFKEAAANPGNFDALPREDLL